MVKRVRGLVVFGTCFIASRRSLARKNEKITGSNDDGCAGRVVVRPPSFVVGFLWKTEVRLSGHSEVFSALELRGKSITVKES